MGNIKPSLILAIMGAILIFLSFVIQLINSNTVIFLLLFIAGIMLCVLCFVYFIAVDLKLFEKLFGAVKSDILGEEKPKVNRNCPNCGRPIPEDAGICPYCGKKFW